MQAREQKIGDLLVVFLQGRLDRAAAPALQQQLLARIHAGQNSLLVDPAAAASGCRAPSPAAGRNGLRTVGPTPDPRRKDDP